MTTRKQLKDLTIRDNFLFAAVMMSGDNCKKLLELVLRIEIERVEVSYEKSIIYNPEFKGIRLDVYARDEKNTCYNIEMQVANQNLRKRSRYYHSQIDMELLLSGHDYEELPEVYVIFICNFDPFGGRKYCYTFENLCMEDTSLGMGDGAKSIFLSTKGVNTGDVPPELVNFLKFVKEDVPGQDIYTEDAFVKQLKETINSVKANREMGQRYMSFEDMFRQERKEGHEEGFREGEISGKILGKLLGKIDAILEILDELGTVPEELKEHILKEKDAARIEDMLKAAIRANSLEQFTETISNL